jgi:hypothetical protein
LRATTGEILNVIKYYEMKDANGKSSMWMIPGYTSALLLAQKGCYTKHYYLTTKKGGKADFEQWESKRKLRGHFAEFLRHGSLDAP